MQFRLFLLYCSRTLTCLGVGPACFLLFLLLPAAALAQGENDVWVFGSHAGMDFSAGAPTLFTAGIGAGAGGVGSVSDAEGRLLFYTNGDTVWNKDHRIMPNGTGLHSVYGANQSSAIVPLISQPGRYCLFTIDDRYDKLNYSLVDLSLDNGLGDIVHGKKALPLISGISSGLTVIAGKGCYLWLVGHRRAKGEFVAFRIDPAGIDTTPVLSSSGFSNGPYDYYACDLKSSPDGRRIALASSGNYFAELHDFDALTGRVSGALLLDSFGPAGRAHSVCFSPNGSKLYLCGGYSGSDLLQYDLSQLPASRAQIINDSSYLNGGMRLGPDGKIYCSRWEGVYTVLHPDLPGKACALSYNYLTLPPGMQSWPASLGVDVVLPRNDASSRATDTLLCAGTSMTLRSTAGLYDRYRWSDGDTAAEKLVLQGAGYWLQSASACRTHTDTFRVLASDCNCVLSLPDAFTPNGDGRNDVFRAPGFDIVETELSVYNRYGQRVFHASNARDAWDGSFGGSACEAGTYYYTAKLRCVRGQVVFKKGDVTLIR